MLSAVGFSILRSDLGGSGAERYDLAYTVTVKDAGRAQLDVVVDVRGETGRHLSLGFSSNAVASSAPASKFRVRSASAGDEELAIEHGDGEWLVRDVRGRGVRVHYEVHLAPRRDASHYAELALSQLDATGGRLLGSDVFLFPIYGEPDAITVDYQLPNGWSLHHPFEVSATRAAPPSLRSLYYSASAVGPHRTLTRRVEDTSIAVAIRGRYSFGDDDILDMITRIVEYQLEFFGQSPRQHYLFVIEPHPRDDDPQMLHYFGLHFDASMIVLLDPRTDRERLLAEPASLCAHEFFHNWMGEQLSQESYAMNWFVEGVTTLYADRTRLAIRMLDHGSWARDLQEDYRLDWDGASARESYSLADAGRTVLSDPAVTRMLYTGGRFAALALDERIVAATQADANLDDLVLALVHRARTEPGFTLTRNHLEEEYSRLTGEELGLWLDQYVYGRGDLPLPGYVLGR